MTILTLGLAEVALIGWAHAATLRVPQDHATISAALAAAVDGDEIVIAPGDWQPEGTLNVSSSITLRGDQGAEETLLPRLRIVGSSSVVIENAQIGCPTATDPGINVVASSLRLGGMVGQGCTGGPAIVAFSSPSLRIEDSHFERWSAPAGAVVVSVGSTVALVNVTTSETSAVGGDAGWFGGEGPGGVLASKDDDAVTIDGCTFTEATAAGQGGTVYVEDCVGVVTISDTTFVDGSAAGGGAVYVDGAGSVVIADTLVDDISSTGALGAVAVRQAGTLSITDASFVGNGVATGGAALFSSGGPVAITRAWFCGNSGLTADVQLLDATATVVASGFARSNGIAVSAEFSDLALTNATFFDILGGGVRAGSSALAVRNVAFADISGTAIEGTGTTVDPSGGYVAWDAVGAFAVGSAWTSPVLPTGLQADVVPGFRAAPDDCDPTALWLAADSPLRDVGDPAALDVDGTRSDIGMFGGLDADLVDADADGFAIDRDCDDDDALSNPGAEEIPYDGIDEDCDGAEINDVDEDGFDGGDGPDCDDDDPLVNPSAEDTSTDEIDQDCDGFDGLNADTGGEDEDPIDGVAKGGCGGCGVGGGPSGWLVFVPIAWLARRRRE